MINMFGNYSLLLVIVLSIILLIFLIYKIKTKSQFNTNLLSLISLKFFFIFFIFFSLIYSFIISDFSNITVYNNSHTTKPLFYKIAGTWGNHEGSLLLWLIVLNTFQLLFIIFSKKFSSNYRLLTIFFQEIIIFGFLLFIFFTSNPFETIFPVPKEGLGLNPILQDPALAIHPPILYFGYAGTSIIFSASLSALINNNLNSFWAIHIKYWISITWLLLTIGILLGSIWAYYELGWGGFWFWDPVENVSLIPWFCLTALLHTVKVLEKREILKSWTIILSISSFAFSLGGTFLVRSGILNSVHTFANDPSRGLFILIFLFIVIALSLIIFFLFSPTDKKKEKNFFWLSKETAILINNWFMMYFLSVVLIGTIYPIFLEVLTNQKISIGPPFYHKLIIPFLIPFLGFMALASNLKWIKDKVEKIKFQKIFTFGASILLAFFIVKISEVKYLFLTVLLVFSFFLLFETIKDFTIKRSSFPKKLAHFSFSILLISILVNGIFSKEISANMKVGEEIEFLDKTILFKSLKISEESNFKSLKAEFEIKDSYNNIIIMTPQIRIYNQPVIFTSEADIKINLFNDNFLVFNILKNEEIFNVRYQFKPLMIWIWLSTIFLAVSGILILIKKTK